MSKVLGAVYAMELETLRERTRVRIAASYARGRVGGRPVKEVAEVFGVSERTARRASAA